MMQLQDAVTAAGSVDDTGAAAATSFISETRSSSILEVEASRSTADADADTLTETLAENAEASLDESGSGPASVSVTTGIEGEPVVDVGAEVGSHSSPDCEASVDGIGTGVLAGVGTRTKRLWATGVMGAEVVPAGTARRAPLSSRGEVGRIGVLPGRLPAAAAAAKAAVKWVLGSVP